MNISFSKGIWLPILLLVLVGSALYSNTLNVPFYFDDLGNIQEPAIQVENGTIEEFSRVLKEGTLKNRPVANLSFAINYYFGGYRVQGYHLVNIFIHLTSSICLYFLFLKTLCLPVNRRRYVDPHGLALSAAVIWLVHPVATQSVTYIVQRMNSMATMFYLLAMLLYVMGRECQKNKEEQYCLPPGVFFIGTVLAGLLSAGSKEIAITLPISLFFYEFCFFQDFSWKWLKKKALLGGLALCVVALGSYVYLGTGLSDIFSLDCSGETFNVPQRLYTQLRVIVHYISLLIYPAPHLLALDYDFLLSQSMFEPLSTFFSFLLLSLILLVATVRIKKERLLSFCIFWFFLNLLLESSIVCLELVYDHRTYLPSTFLSLFFVLSVYRLCRNKYLLYSLVAVCCVVFAFWTMQRNELWQDRVDFGKHEVLLFPNHVRGLNNYALALAKEGELEEAERVLRVAIEKDPSAEIVRNSLAEVLLHMGNSDEAEFHLREAIKLKPDYADARFGLGELLRDKGEYAEAAHHFSILLESEKDNSIIAKHLGNTLLRSGKLEKAMKYLIIAHAKNKKDTEVLLDMGEILTRTGGIDKAIEIYDEVLAIDQHEIKAHYNLALLLVQRNRNIEAVSHFENAVRGANYPMDMLYNYGNHLFRLGRTKDAEQVYGNFLQVIPTVVNTLNNLGLVFVQEKKYKEAIYCFSMAIALDPSSEMMQKNLRMAQEALNTNK